MPMAKLYGTEIYFVVLSDYEVLISVYPTTKLSFRTHFKSDLDGFLAT